MSEVPIPRPSPPRSLREQAAAWLGWFGPVRLISSIVAIGVVVGGGYWLVRSPPPTTEAGLPVVATGASTTTAPTLPPPVTTSSAPPTTAPSAVVVVHVAGAVNQPGVYRLDGDDRVHAAIEAAGGASADADLDGLNLAAGVADGQRIYVPRSGEVDPASVPSGGEAVGGSAPVATQPAGPLDINRATASELEILPGIGPATAAAIIDDRDRNGPFASVDDLDRVSGIGPSKLAAIRDLVTV